MKYQHQIDEKINKAYDSLVIVPEEGEQPVSYCSSCAREVFEGEVGGDFGIGEICLACIFNELKRFKRSTANYAEKEKSGG